MVIKQFSVLLKFTYTVQADLLK